MSLIWRRVLISLAASLALIDAAAAADCDVLIANFKTAIADKAFEKLKDAMAAIADDNACNFNIDAYRIQEINSIIDIAGAAPTDDARKQMLEFVEGVLQIGGDWRSAENLGDFYARRGEYDDALGAYETAISFLSRAAPPATREHREELLARAEAAKSQASDDQEGQNSSSRFASSARDVSGQLRRDLFAGAVARLRGARGAPADQFLLRASALHARPAKRRSRNSPRPSSSRTSKPSLSSGTRIRAAIMDTMSNCPSGARPRRATICSPTA